MTVTFGLLGETRDSLKESFEFALRIDVDSVQFSVATPYPGTPFYEQLKKEGRVETLPWEKFDGYNSSVIKYEDFTNDYLHEFARTSNLRWLRRKVSDPAWVLRQGRYYRPPPDVSKLLWKAAIIFCTLISWVYCSR